TSEAFVILVVKSTGVWSTQATRPFLKKTGSPRNLIAGHRSTPTGAPNRFTRSPKLSECLSSLKRKISLTVFFNSLFEPLPVSTQKAHVLPRRLLGQQERPGKYLS